MSNQSVGSFCTTRVARATWQRGEIHHAVSDASISSKLSTTMTQAQPSAPNSGLLLFDTVIASQQWKITIKPTTMVSTFEFSQWLGCQRPVRAMMKNKSQFSPQ
ncbi:MAG: hypothetical protein WCJ07_09680, partial [Verrucomicrobiota bacterium]